MFLIIRNPMLHPNSAPINVRVHLLYGIRWKFLNDIFLIQLPSLIQCTCIISASKFSPRFFSLYPRSVSLSNRTSVLARSTRIKSNQRSGKSSHVIILQHIRTRLVNLPVNPSTHEHQHHKTNQKQN
jgi:hypothetical protein